MQKANRALFSPFAGLQNLVPALELCFADLQKVLRTLFFPLQPHKILFQRWKMLLQPCKTLFQRSKIPS